jgi:hypothetical protein
VKAARTQGPARAPRRRRSLLPSAGLEPRETARRAWWAARGIALAALVLSASAAAAWMTAGAAALPALALSRVAVEGNLAVPAAEIERLAGVSPGEALLSLDLARVRQGVLRHPWVSEAAVARLLPGTLRVRVRERAPLALLSQGGRFALVAEDGVVLVESVAAGDRYPIVSGIVSTCRAGERAEEALPALAALKALAGAGGVSYDRISEVAAAADGRILVSLTGSGTMLVMAAQDPEGQARRLARLAAAGRFDPRASGYDLRFAGRVVRLPDPEPGKSPKGGKTHGQV